MEQVSVLYVEEAVSLDYTQIRQLHELLGHRDAEDVVMRAIGELSTRLVRAEKLFMQENWLDLRKCVRMLIAIGEQIGMRSLAAVSRHVVTAIDKQDQCAIAATLHRLMRIGDRSLSDFWELQNLSG